MTFLLFNCSWTGLLDGLRSFQLAFDLSEAASQGCDSPLLLEDARSPDVRPLCPQPRRAFLPEAWHLAELPDLPTLEKKELSADFWRPSSSVSTSAGPTPSPDSFEEEGRRRRGSEAEEQLTTRAVVEMSKTQQGSKALQKRLLKGHVSVIQVQV